MNIPKVSILIATWNRKNLLKGAVSSVLNQSFSNWELIIADDGSDDGTENLIREYSSKDKDNRIKYSKNDHVGRIAVVSNRGLKIAKGKYVAILDDDDFWVDNKKIEKQVNFLEKNADYVGCGGGMVAINEKGDEIFKFLKPESNEEIRERALYANPMANSTTMFRRDVARAIGLYDENLPQFADWDFWLKIGTKGKLYNFQEYFTAYLMWDKSSSFMQQKENAKSALIIIKRYKGIYSGFTKAFLLAITYRIYVLLPMILRKLMNPIFSSIKKKIFSK